MSDDVRTTIYLPRSLQKLFKELITRERKTDRDVSMSSKVREWIDQYVKAHYPGNPQRPITFFGTGGGLPLEKIRLCGDCGFECTDRREMWLHCVNNQHGWNWKGVDY